MIKFEETSLDPSIVSAVASLGFTELTPIQEKAIPFLLENEERRDLIALAQTGTGKTAAFGLPMVELVSTEFDFIQCLILCPTRELCIQIAKDLNSYAKNNKQINVVPVYGGSNIQDQIRAINKGAQIIVGTPGRALDLIRRKRMDLSFLMWCVLDEADEMLNMGFKEELDAILSETPKEKQTLLFSATMPPKISEITRKYLKNPFEISVDRKNSGAENVTHEFYLIQPRQRYLALKRLADVNPGIYGIVFCRTRAETKEVAERLIEEGYNAEALHGDLTQVQRDLVMNRFRSKAIQILVATDVAARGVDIDSLTHIINFQLPTDSEVYVHRSGRTGRAGRSGVCISLITNRDKYKIQSLQKMIGKEFTRERIPGGAEICEKQLFHLIENIKEVQVDEGQIGPYIPAIMEQLEGMDREELIKHFVSSEFNRFLSYYKNAPDLNGPPERRKKDRDRGERGDRRDRSDRGRPEPNPRSRDRSSSRFSGFYMNVGANSSMSPRKLIEMINEETRNRDIKIGRIRILKKATWFEVESGYEKELKSAFDDAHFEGEKVLLQEAADAPTSQPPMKSHKSRSKPFKKSFKKPGIKKKKKKLI